jgi:tRNA pseudouridine38-40 synthase
VQEELERALRTVLGDRGHDGEPLTLSVAGRTDRGVHAWGQVASYAHEAIDPLRLNTLLGSDIAVLAAEPAPGDFCARRAARSRTYCYRVQARRARDVFMRGYALWWPHPLDFDVLCECARALLGVHDFTAFTPNTPASGATSSAPNGAARRSTPRRATLALQVARPAGGNCSSSGSSATRSCAT